MKWSSCNSAVYLMCIHIDCSLGAQQTWCSVQNKHLYAYANTVANWESSSLPEIFGQYLNYLGRFKKEI